MSLEDNKTNKNNFLTVHGHFYQPPRENPWLESIETQDSAAPFHDWNERIAYECYTPNSVSRIVNAKGQILDIVNNYEYISYNFGPTLLSWLEVHAPETYQRILDSDKNSMQVYSGHGNALAQVYNHMIMPLANEKDKYTQTIWGVKDFQYRFGRLPEGIWLAETAVDHDTLKVLVDCGIKFTILSPYQGYRTRALPEKCDIGKECPWKDVSWGNVDPGRSYRYFLKDGSDRYIDLFFYDGSISKSVAFDNLLMNGDAFIGRMKDGISNLRDYEQLVNIATDGESYGHHTMLGNMALTYALKRQAEKVGFEITNYAEFLETHPPEQEVEIVEPSSWSCSHGVGRWERDCGCSTGAAPGWNQKWRKPLREALDWLRDELAMIYEKNASKYLKNPWQARNKYIEVMLDRKAETVEKFCNHESVRKLSQGEMVNVIKLLEMQRHAMLMYTSCGWFFSEISGIETVQILKYAARSMQIAEEFMEIDLETNFLKILSDATSNIPNFGTGKDVYLKFVKPSIVSVKQVVSHWAISSIFEEYSDETQVYCYNIKTLDYKKAEKANTKIVIGRIEVVSNITFEKHDMIFGLLHFGGEDFHCVIRGFTGQSEYNKIKEKLFEKYNELPLTEVIRGFDEFFGKEYYTLKNLFIEERRKIIDILIQDKLEQFASTYKQLYNEAKGPMLQLKELGLKIPDEFRMAAEYALSCSLNGLASNPENLEDPDVLHQIFDIRKEGIKLKLNIDLQPAREAYSKFITDKVKKIALSRDTEAFENLTEVIMLVEKLELWPDLSQAQNIFYSSIYTRISELLEEAKKSDNKIEDKKFINAMIELGEHLNFNLDEYKVILSKINPHVEV